LPQIREDLGQGPAAALQAALLELVAAHRRTHGRSLAASSRVKMPKRLPRLVTYLDRPGDGA
jgi:hypothetical protein